MNNRITRKDLQELIEELSRQMRRTLHVESEIRSNGYRAYCVVTDTQEYVVRYEKLGNAYGQVWAAVRALQTQDKGVGDKPCRDCGFLHKKHYRNGCPFGDKAVQNRK